MAADPTVVAYIKSALAEGKSRQEITRGLISEGGWNPIDVANAFAVVQTVPVSVSTPLAPVPPTTPAPAAVVVSTPAPALSQTPITITPAPVTVPAPAPPLGFH